jgi:hypothetical protein
MNVRLAAAAAMASTGLAVGLALTLPASAAQQRPAQPADPPECVHVTIVDNSGQGPWLHTVFCGLGSEGLSPLLRAVAGNGPLIVDGAALTRADCPASAPCVVLWPKSPQTGP